MARAAPRGGRSLVALSEDNIDEVALRRAVADPGCGAVASFVGVTRDNWKGRPVTRLEYEAYGGMAEKELGRIVAEARVAAASAPHEHGGAAGLAHVAVQHRTGVVPVGEASVAIFVSAPHRGAALEAVEYIINQLKARVPVWKKEFFTDAPAGGVWKANSECGCGKAASGAAASGPK